MGMFKASYDGIAGRANVPINCFEVCGFSYAGRGRQRKGGALVASDGFYKLVLRDKLFAIANAFEYIPELFAVEAAVALFRDGNILAVNFDIGHEGGQGKRVVKEALSAVDVLEIDGVSLRIKSRCDKEHSRNDQARLRFHIQGIFDFLCDLPDSFSSYAFGIGNLLKRLLFACKAMALLVYVNVRVAKTR